MKYILFIKCNSKIFLFSILLLFTLYSAVLIGAVGERYNLDNSLVLLSSQFLHGHLSLVPAKDLPLGDISKYGGKFYLYFGPLPSIVLMPFVFIFGKTLPQIIIGLGSMFVSFIAVYSISKSLKFSSIDALWVALFFVFSTVLFSASIINISAYQVEAMGVPLVLLSLHGYLTKKSPLLIGLYLGLAIMTRATLMLSVIFFIVEFLQKRLSSKFISILLIPVILGCLLLGIYNYARFHSVFETGYTYNITLKSYPLSLNLQYGYMSPIHIPANLYSFLLMPPEPLLKNPHGFVLKFPYLKANPWGMAIWFTSPLFLLLLYKFRKGKYTVSALAAIIGLAIPIFLYYSIGFAQFGYRYTLDFLPFLLLLLVPSLLPKLSRTAIVLIIIGVIFNCIYITSLWEVYPLFGIYQ